MKTKTQHFTISTKSGNGYSSESSSPSPPSSPRRSSHGPHYRRRLLTKAHSLSRHRESCFSSFLLRCNVRLFLLLPLFYFSGLLLCVCTFSALFRSVPPLPGSVYRSPDVFLKLWPEIQSDNESAIELSSIWKHRRRLTERRNCSSATTGGRSGSTQPTGYLIIEANGGLNQQRSSICNAVAVAGLLNAVLVIPQFQFHSVWRDPSGFGDIFDEDHFINTLRGYVTVVRELPEALMERYDNNISNIPIFRAKAWAPASYYLGDVYPILQKQGVIRISPFANRLAMEVPSNIQYLRCLANYEALRFSAPIAKLARKLVNRMIKKSTMSSGKYVSVHLRFEEDMVAFSCCEYDGGKTEKLVMDLVREKGWRGKFKSKSRVIEPGLNRINGKCPLTPLEVGMMLRGMGFDNNTSIYLASGKIYQAEKNLAPLLKLFPLLQTKDSLATRDELASFEGYSSKLAALDYTVCLFSEVFVTTQGGNLPHFLMGHRRFLYNGHAKTIKPDKQKLVFLLQDTSISWKSFKEKMKLMRMGNDRIMGTKANKASKRSSIYSYPLPECWCLQGSPNFTGSSMLSHQHRFLV